MTINNDETSTLPRPITSQYYLDHLAQPEDIIVQVTEEDFDQALAELIPSVSAQELEHYKQVQKMFNSDDFAKEAEAAAAAEAEKKRMMYQEQEERELAEALRKVEEAQNMISAENRHHHHEEREEDEGYVDVGKGKGKEVKGKGKGKGKERPSPDEMSATESEAPIPRAVSLSVTVSLRGVGLNVIDGQPRSLAYLTAQTLALTPSFFTIFDALQGQ